MAATIRRLGVFSVFVVLCITGFSAGAVAAQDGAQKAILVTGASTGIGRKITEVLAEKGFFVYAGARKQADIDALNAIENVQAIKLDVTVQDEIDAAVETVKEGGKGLHGLINNAGVLIVGPIADVPLDEFQWLMDVNVYGVYRMAQAFLPMLIESKGRISTIGSINGISIGGFYGMYGMSKHAIEAFTDSLAYELEPLGVSVSVIEPGTYNTAIGESALARVQSQNERYAQEGSPFAEAFQELLDGDWDRFQYKAPDEVAEAAVHAMSAAAPLRRYMVVPNEAEAAKTIDRHIERLVQLNQWQAYSYSREELIAKMDAVPPSDTATAELTALLHDFLANSGTEAAHARIWSDDLVYTSSNGSRYGKADIMGGFADAEEPEEPEEPAEESEGPQTVYTGEDVNIKVFGTTAVVTFRLVGTPDDGSVTSEYFNSGTFLKQHGLWRAVSWQATIIPPVAAAE
jgi:NAD(P)-dependent dehydrogenase (short-subunit alcohol dehydrogenase family)